MLLGYGRVSKNEQNLDRQLDQLKAQGCERIYIEKITGTKKERPELNKLLDNLRSGDIVVVCDLTRLSRSTKDLFWIIEQLEKRNSNLRSLKESWIDTTTPQGKLMFTLFSGISQFERDLISQRTKEGLESARARGRKGGRPFKPSKEIELSLRMYDSKEYSISEISKATGISKTSLYRYLSRRSNEKGV